MKKVLAVLLAFVSVCALGENEDVKQYLATAKSFAAAQNYTEAVKWWRKAAEQGDAQAQTILGWCYFYG